MRQFVTTRSFRCILAALSVAALSACGAQPAVQTSSIRPTVPSTASAPSTMTFLLDPAALGTLPGKAAAFQPVLDSCAKNTGATPLPMADLNLPDHYTPTGTSDVDNPLAVDSQQAWRDAVCYRVSGQINDAVRAQTIIDAWATTLTTVSTPQGKDDLNVSMPYMIGAASWVRGVNNWDDGRFIEFINRVVLPNNLLTNPNNHGMWATLMVAAAGEYTHNLDQVAQARTRWEQILAGAVANDGTLTREITRSDDSDYHGGPSEGIKGLAYTHYSLLPASLTAQVLDQTGSPEWSTPSGALLQRAFGKAAQWTSQPSTFPYYATNHGTLDGVMNASYFPLLLRHYPNADAQQVIQRGGITADGFYLTRLFA